MIIVPGEQGTPEWHQMRAGNPGASNFDKIITGAGQRSKQTTVYLYQLAGELISGPEGGFSSYHMQRGIEMESEAREFYEFTTGNKVEQVSMCFKDERRRYHCSPDGLMSDIGRGLEIKCPKLSTHVKYLLNKKLPTEYYVQVQGSMLVTGYKAWDFLSYYPGMPPLLLTISRDNLFCDGMLRPTLESFCDDLEAIHERLLCR